MQADNTLVTMMKDRQFKQFAAEVLQQGADAVLPQNLPDRWLNALLEEAEIFQEEDSDIEETCAGLLSAVILILSQHRGHPDQMEIRDDPPTLYELLRHDALRRER